MIHPRGILFLVLLLAASACTKGGGGGGGDDDDDDDDDGTTGSVSLTVGDTPVSGIAVTVHDSQGTFLEQHATGDDGAVSFAVPPGGSFAVYFDDSEIGGSPQTREVIHVLDPAPDSVWSLPFPESTPYVDPAYLDVTLSPVPGNATAAIVYAPCSSNVNPIGFFLDEVLASCDGVTTIPHVLGMAMTNTGSLEGWGLATNVAVTPGGATASVTIDASNTAFDQVQFILEDIPTDYRSWTKLGLHFDGFQFALDVNNYGPGQPVNQISVRSPASLATRAYLEAFVSTDHLVGMPGEDFGTTVWGTPAAVVGSASVASFPLARVMLSTPDFSTPARPSVTWTRATGSIGAVGWMKIAALTATTETVIHRVLFAPGSLPSDSLVLAAVPDALSAWRPAEVSNFDVTFEESGALGTRFSEFVLPPSTADGTRRHASGTFATE